MNRRTLIAALAVISFAIGCSQSADDAGTTGDTTGQATKQNEAPTDTPPAATTVAFADVKAILDRSCVKCHGAKNPREDLNLTSYETLMKGGEHGPVVVPGNPADSRIVKFITGQETPRMPYNQPPLPDEDISTIREWIQQGAKN